MKVRKRNPWLAGVLTFLALGVGHVYAGAPGRGLALVALYLAGLIAGGLFGLYSTFFGFVALAVFVVVLYLYVIADAARIARNNREYAQAWYNRWYWYVLFGAIVIVGFNLLFAHRGTLLGYESYRLSANSMKPTLRAGDLITVDTRYTRPRIGDVVVFASPTHPSIPYVKRIAALGGDSIAIVDGQVVVNGRADKALAVPAAMRRERYSISVPAIRVPAGEVYVLGDWRDNSSDSRFWGPIPADKIIGKVTYIWFSRDYGRIGTKVR